MKKLLLDECLPRKLKPLLGKCDSTTVPEAGFAGLKNGVLLDLAEKAGFQIFLTVDQGIEYQQNLGARMIAIILLRAKSNRLEDIVPHIGEILSVSASIEPGGLVRVPSKDN